MAMTKKVMKKAAPKRTLRPGDNYQDLEGSPRYGGSAQSSRQKAIDARRSPQGGKDAALAGSRAKKQAATKATTAGQTMKRAAKSVISMRKTDAQKLKALEKTNNAKKKKSTATSSRYK